MPWSHKVQLINCRLLIITRIRKSWYDKFHDKYFFDKFHFILDKSKLLIKILLKQPIVLFIMCRNISITLVKLTKFLFKSSNYWFRCKLCKLISNIENWLKILNFCWFNQCNSCPHYTQWNWLFKSICFKRVNWIPSASSFLISENRFLSSKWK